MRIGFDGLAITARPAGVGAAAIEILAHLARLDRAPEVVAVLPANSAGDARVASLPNVEVVRAPVAGPDTPRALFFQHRTMARILRERRCDALFSPAFVVPLLREPPPPVVFFHDAAWRRFPETKSSRFRAYMDFAVPRSCRRARHVATCSEFAKHELLDLVPDLDPAKVTVVPLGARALPEPRDADTVLRRLGVPRPFVLAVSNFDPRKNLEALVRAWRRLRTASAASPALVLAGDPDRAAALRARVGATPSEPLVTPGYVTDADLAALYSAAEVVAVPSLYEGFGLPVLEAFRAGVPVACSNRASLPEVAGDAAVLFDPTDEDAMADALAEAMRHGTDRDRRVARGRARAAEHTWARVATAVAAVLRTAASER
jgi:glycosyltransferase involved in cell wall biosynthesis